jgi:hypothetical protein
MGLLLALLMFGQPEFPRILAITVSGKSLDLYTGSRCFETGACVEKGLIKSAEGRIAVGYGTSVLAAYGCYELEKRDKKFRWVKWGYLAMHLGFAIHNEIETRHAR